MRREMNIDTGVMVVGGIHPRARPPNQQRQMMFDLPIDFLTEFQSIVMIRDWRRDELTKVLAFAGRRFNMMDSGQCRLERVTGMDTESIDSGVTQMGQILRRGIDVLLSDRSAF